MALSVVGSLLPCSYRRQPPARFTAVRSAGPSPCRLQRPLIPPPLVSILSAIAVAASRRRRLPRLRAHLAPPLLLGSGDGVPSLAVFSDSLKILEWDKVCDAVASFAGTALGRDAAKSQLLSVDVGFEESRRLLDETTAAVRLIDYGGGGMEFAGVDTVLVKSAITRVSRGSPLDGLEAIAVAGLIQFAEALQITLKTAIKEDSEYYNHFMPLSELIINFVISHSFVKSVQQVIDEDGSVKESASSEVRRSRDQVRILERKLYQLMDKLIRQDKNDTASLEMCIVSGRCCLKVMSDQRTLDGLLLSSGSGVGSIIEPISAVPLNDELQQARVLVTKAEEDVLSKLTDKMVAELEDIQKLLQSIIRLDVVFARAKYGMTYGGTFPEIYLPSHQGDPTENLSADETFSRDFSSSNRKWKLYMPKAYHPLLLQRHRENLHKAKKDLANATSEIRRRNLQGKPLGLEGGFDSHLQSLKLRVFELEKSPPVAVDFVVSQSTSVLVITGPNTGGKTISLKTVGLASLMAKTGLYVLAAEPVKIPWFDAIFADIGDEQSLTQSLSTFSGHLKQIGAIRSQSTNKSLVLLDEVGAGTNPLEGAALGMSILESFAEAKSYLTMATTHHGELKTLKYSNDAFENACVEFDEASLKPTYKILWGVPGRSNAINIAERLGLCSIVIEGARKLHGEASAEINEVIVDMEKFKQNFQQDLQQAEDYLLVSKELHEKLLVAKQKVAKNVALQKKRKTQAISDCGTLARSILRNRLQQFRESLEAKSKLESTSTNRDVAEDVKQPRVPEISSKGINSSESNKTLAGETKIPSVGDTVSVPSLGKQAVVLKVEASKGEVLVQASNMKLRLKFRDIRNHL